MNSRNYEYDKDYFLGPFDRFKEKESKKQEYPDFYPEYLDELDVSQYEKNINDEEIKNNYNERLDYQLVYDPKGDKYRQYIFVNRTVYNPREIDLGLYDEIFENDYQSNIDYNLENLESIRFLDDLENLDLEMATILKAHMWLTRDNAFNYNNYLIDYYDLYDECIDVEKTLDENNIVLNYQKELEKNNYSEKFLKYLEAFAWELRFNKLLDLLENKSGRSK